MGSAQRVALMAMTTLSLLLIAVLVAVFAFNGYRPLVAAIAGVWWGLMPLVLFDGGVSAAAPAWMIRWREDAMQRPGSKLPMQAEMRAGSLSSLRPTGHSLGTAQSHGVGFVCSAWSNSLFG